MSVIAKAGATPKILVGSRRIRLRRQILFWALTGPAILLFSIFLLEPLINMFRVSTLDWRGIIKPYTYVGLKNYVRLFGDEHFFNALRNTAIHLVFVLGTVLPCSFMLGFFLSLQPRGFRLLRSIFFLPGMLSAPALAMIFVGIYMPDGIVTHFLRVFALDSLAHNWLTDKTTALGAVIAVDLWGGIGWYAVMFYASLSNVNRELYEAAQMDGANYWNIMWKVAFPLSINFFRRDGDAPLPVGFNGRRPERPAADQRRSRRRLADPGVLSPPPGVREPLPGLQPDRGRLYLYDRNSGNAADSAADPQPRVGWRVSLWQLF